MATIMFSICSTTLIAVLATKSNYNLKVGDIITFDFSFNITTWNPAPTTWNLISIITGVSIEVINMPTATGVYHKKIAFYADANVAEELRFALAMTNVTAAFTVEWVSVDNFRVHPALDYLTPADANDATGVV